MSKDAKRVSRVFAEFAVIFAGVTLGLLADDWRRDREDRVSERLSLSEVSADLRTDSVELESMRRRMMTWDQATLWINRAPAQGTPSDTIVDRVSGAAFVTFYQQVSSGYVSLKDGGQLGLIQDTALRRSIIDYYEVDQPYMLEFNTRVTRAHEDAMAVLFEYFSFPAIESRVSYWPPGRLALVQPWSEFKRDPRTRRSFEILGITAANWAVRIEAVLGRNAELQRVISEYLGGR